MTRSAATPKGFTMVELIMTLIVLGILAVAVLPRFASKDSYDTRGFSDQVRAAVQFARKVAVASGRNVCVVTTSTTLALTMAGTRGLGQPCTGGGVIDPAKGGAYSLSRPDGSTVTLSVINLTFRADGSATAAGPTPYKITITGDTTYDVTIESETGHVH